MRTGASSDAPAWPHDVITTLNGNMPVAGVVASPQIYVHDSMHQHWQCAQDIQHCSACVRLAIAAQTRARPSLQCR
jgi:hypothetical protein